LNDVLEAVVSQITLEDRAREIEIVKELDPDLPEIQADLEQWHQVVLNIILNAVSAHGATTIGIESKSDERGVLATVLDDGEGISPEAAPRIFDPFFTTKDTGTGLGLSISHRIVREHGGRLVADSQHGKGAKFSVWLPIERERNE
jgi:signal transduction histidine kinase